jgi:hypothetical protein
MHPLQNKLIPLARSQVARKIPHATVEKGFYKLQ